jgi:hypothetical protein
MITLPVVLSGCETWLLTLREECRQREFENRVLRRKFEPKRVEVTGEWRKPRNEELNDLHSSPNSLRAIKLRKMRWAGHVESMGDRRGACKVLLGKYERKRPLGRSRCRWEDKIKMDLQEVGMGGIDLIDLAQDRDRCQALVNAVMNLQAP